MPKNDANSSSGSELTEVVGPWVDPDDAPELTDELVERLVEYGEFREGDKVLRHGRPPIGDPAKGHVTIRLDADVLEAYTALGRGWQKTLNEDLRRARKLEQKREPV
jgi:uncharacterized protein (DUF4415 family)